MPTHVLHVVKGLGPGGAERLLVSVTEARSPDLAVDVAFVLPWKHHLVDELRAAGAGTHRLGGQRGLADPRWVVRLVRLVRRLQPDVVHLHSPAVAAVARPVLRALRPRVAIVSTEHNLWDSFAVVTRLANAVTAGIDDARLAVSDEVRASMSARAAASTRVVVHGVPVDRIAARQGERQSARDELGVGDDEIVVACVANLREKKDLPTLLRAAAAARSAEPRLRFVHIGQGPDQDALRRLHDELGLGDGVRLLGYRDDPVHVLAGADLFTLTSRFEGLPIALLEALALGLPAVVSDAGAMPTVVRDGREGVVVAAGDHQAFARAYVGLARDTPRRSAMGEAARARARDFDIAAAAEAIESRYKALVKKGETR